MSELTQLQQVAVDQLEQQLTQVKPIKDKLTKQATLERLALILDEEIATVLNAIVEDIDQLPEQAA